MQKPLKERPLYDTQPDTTLAYHLYPWPQRGPEWSVRESNPLRASVSVVETYAISQLDDSYFEYNAQS